MVEYSACTRTSLALSNPPSYCRRHWRLPHPTAPELTLHVRWCGRSARRYRDSTNGPVSGVRGRCTVNLWAVFRCWRISLDTIFEVRSDSSRRYSLVDCFTQLPIHWSLFATTYRLYFSLRVLSRARFIIYRRWSFVTNFDEHLLLTSRTIAFEKFVSLSNIITSHEHFTSEVWTSGYVCSILMKGNSSTSGRNLSILSQCSFGHHQFSLIKLHGVNMPRTILGWLFPASISK